MVISFPFDIFTWKHLIGGISNPESLDRYVLMICDLRSPSSVYCCNRREVVPVWPLWLCGRDPARPHQASQAAHRSVWLPRPRALGPSIPSWSSTTCIPDLCKSLYLRVYWKFCLNRILIHLPLYIYEVGLLRVWGIRCPLSVQVKQEGKSVWGYPRHISVVRSLPQVLCEAGASAFLSTLASSQSVSPVCVPAQPIS